MKIGFYPGCSLTGSSREYNESLLAIAKEAGVELYEIKDWNCCGATAAHNLNKELSLTLPARNLALAELDQMDELVVPCAACYNRLVMTQHELGENESLKKIVSEKLQIPLQNRIKIINVLQFLEKHIVPRLEQLVKKPLDFDVACYYGCLLVRPQRVIKTDLIENATTKNVTIHQLDALPIDRPYITDCCVAWLIVSNPEIE